jgi:GNAT superfamily N-acetyltransferase
VFVLESHRGRGLGKWLVKCVANYSELQGPKLMLLGTRDAHELYRRYGGFQGIKILERWMIRSNA